MIGIGDKVRIEKKLHPNGKDGHVHFGKMATTLRVELGMVEVSIDNFPNCNHRALFNRFWYDKDELRVISTGREVDPPNAP